MKPFNLEQAKQGKPVITRSGLPVRIVCFDANCGDYPLVVLVGLVNDGTYEDVKNYTKNGKIN